MILEALSILGAGVALIAVQPPLRKWFPEKPKKTVWEEFWAEAAGRHRHWERCGVGCTSDSSDIADHVLAAAKKPDSIAHAYETLCTRYVPQIKEQLNAAGDIMQRVIDERRAEQAKEAEAAEKIRKALEPESDKAAIDKAIAARQSTVWLPRSQRWIDLVPPELPRSMPTLGSEEWQRKGPTEPLAEQRRRVSDYAVAYDKQVYLDHASNEYRLREKPPTPQAGQNLERVWTDEDGTKLNSPFTVRISNGTNFPTADADYCSLAANQARLEEALFRAHYENGRAALEAARSMAPVVGSADSDMSFAMYQQKLQQAKLQELLK